MHVKLYAALAMLLVAMLLPFSGGAAGTLEDNQEWPTVNRDWARRGYVDANLPDKLELLWEFPGEFDVIRSQSSPAVAGGRVYFTAENNGSLYIYALDSENGSLVWSYRAGRDAGAGFLPNPTVVNGKVYVGDENYLYAFDAETGEVKWRFEVPWGEKGLHGVDSAPVVIDDRVYFGSWDGWFYCIDANTGELIWEYSDGDGKMGHIMGAPAVVDGVIYFGTGAGGVGYTGTVYALNAENGGLIWKYYIGDEISASPAVVDNVVYIGAGFMGHLPGDGMWALDARTGEVLWYFDTENKRARSSAVAHDKVYFGANDGYVYALDAENGSVVWRYYIGGHIFSSPIVVGDKVLIGDDRVHVLDAETGMRLLEFGVGSVHNPPAFAYGKVYFVDYQDGLKAYGPPPSTPPAPAIPWPLILIGVLVAGVVVVLLLIKRG